MKLPCAPLLHVNDALLVGDVEIVQHPQHAVCTEPRRVAMHSENTFTGTANQGEYNPVAVRLDAGLLTNPCNSLNEHSLTPSFLRARISRSQHCGGINEPLSQREFSSWRDRKIPPFWGCLAA